MKNVLFVLVLLTFQNIGHAQSGDIDLLRRINVERNENLDASFLFITNSATPIAIGAPSIMLTIGLIKKDSLLKQKSLMMIGSLVTSSTITLVMKYGIDRERPFETYSDIVKLTKGGSPSFPSGHTSMAFSIATSTSIAYPKWYVIAPSFLWASAVGYSRMHLGVHYPSDVLVGAIVGSGSAFLSAYVTKKILEKRASRGVCL